MIDLYDDYRVGDWIAIKDQRGTVYAGLVTKVNATTYEVDILADNQYRHRFVRPDAS